MDAVLALVMAWFIAFAINLMPAFMPPTWSVLAVIHVTTSAPLLPLTIGGAVASALGRTALALGAGKLGDFLPKTDRENARALGDFLERHHRWGLAIVFLGCLGPLPSNALFIAVGISRLRLVPIAIVFFLSRMIADTFWVWSAGVVSRNAEGVFRDQVSSWQGIALQVAGIVLIVAVFRLPWAKWLGSSPSPTRRAGRRSQRATRSA